MTNKPIWCLMALNLMLGMLVAVSPARADSTAEGFRDCCKRSTGGIEFCCEDCCWFSSDCAVNGDCASVIE